MAGIEAVEVAYKSVPTPIEGTILTVAREIGVAAKAAEKTDDLRLFLAHLVEAAAQSVERTPDLLPVLKKAGVVDSGGKGLFFVFEGMYRAVMGQSMHGASEPVVSAVADHENEHQYAKGSACYLRSSGVLTFSFWLKNQTNHSA